jgi:hypothetical protein
MLVALSLPAAARIFVCVDEQGRRLTSDRPIPDCLNREQTELNPSGTVRRKIAPAMTDQERVEAQERERQALLERQRLIVERQREQALLVRYPDQAAHDRERALAIEQITEVIKVGTRRISELQEQRTALESELDGNRRDPQHTPTLIRRQIQDVQQSLDLQEQFVVEQLAEKRRINQRFDAELAKLRNYWIRKPVMATPEPRVK